MGTAFLPLILLAFQLGASIAETQSKDLVTTEAAAKEKRSQEDIMFGNQQNKPAGMVDDFLAFPSASGAVKTPPVAVSNDSQSASPSGEKKKQDKHLKGSKAAKEAEAQRFDYYDYVQEPDENRVLAGTDDGYTIDNTEPQTSGGLLPGPQQYNPHELTDYPEDDYDGVLYRRKRTPAKPAQVKGHGKSIRKRSYRSNLEDLLGGNRRLPRRALRPKRDTGVEQLLNWLGMIRRGQDPNGPRLYEDEMNELNDEDQSQPELSYFYDVPKEELNLPDLPPGFLEALVAEEAAGQSLTPNRDLVDLESLQVGPPDNSPDWETRYSFPYPYRRSPQPANLGPQPSGFYPIDYRYVLVPGQTKRKRSGDHRRRMGGIRLQDQQLDGSGLWGGFAQRRRDMSDVDQERLYALASLLSEDSPSDELERRRKRRAVKA